MVATIQDHNFSEEQCAVGLTAALNVIDKWKATPEQARSILGIPESTYVYAKKQPLGWSVSLDPEQLRRISVVLNIHAALSAVFDNQENIYGFPSMENHNEFFNGRSPLEVMAKGDLVSLNETFKRIDSLRVS
ncbi:hypothetical protein IB232_23250 [Pseudomonas sp. PDM15]|uniref:antitoxin Xre-like helix-turn-helix domain-containing protein n=1 Tax=Pseudomonas sp. PDM15 TaxID=2769303 RepID=UPI001785797F|nr:antitoxin Xre-like helix-turn-helix domain-containing protein [Pseudomonas sp. PDM15]MBD9428257.1 hypothetical protein [Pseudomonas sp. PDM15]